MTLSIELKNIKNTLNTAIVGTEILIFDELDSTNELAKVHLAQNAPEGLVIVADSQTKGRGRLGRSWHSEPGVGIYFSILLKPKINPALFSKLTLMASIAVVQAINGTSRSRATLKWPNDILLNKKKLCGILAEYRENQGGIIIGIGVNANQRQFPESLKEIATSLRIENGEPVNRVHLLQSILTHLDREYSDFLDDKDYNLSQRWTGHSEMFGENIVLTHGIEKVHGIAVRLSHEGKLVVQTEEGLELCFDSGEVTLSQNRH